MISDDEIEKICTEIAKEHSDRIGSGWCKSAEIACKKAAIESCYQVIDLLLSKKGVIKQ